MALNLKAEEIASHSGKYPFDPPVLSLTATNHFF
jgi:hypothetical protein